MIEPTNGRVVWFWPDQEFRKDISFTWHDTTKPLAAIVAHVFSHTLVNLTVIDSHGMTWPVQNVRLLQGRRSARR